MGVTRPGEREVIEMAMMELEPVKDVVLVTCGWAVMYYVFMQMGPATKQSGGGPKRSNAMSRIFGNLHEQSIIFLVSMWMMALFVDADRAASIGKAYLGFRLLYPMIVIGCGGNILPAIFLSPMPQYGICCWFVSCVC